MGWGGSGSQVASCRAGVLIQVIAAESLKQGGEGRAMGGESSYHCWGRTVGLDMPAVVQGEGGKG